MDSAPSLADLPPGSTGRLLGYRSTDSAYVRFRELGLLPGTAFTVVRRAPLGDPIEISIGGALLSIRRDQAAHIAVEADSTASGTAVSR